MQRCSDKCEGNHLVLCPHKFDFQAEIIYCNGNGFNKKPDLYVFLYFLKKVREAIKAGLVNRNGIFAIITKDVDFLIDAEREWYRACRLSSARRNRLQNSDAVFIKDVDTVWNWDSSSILMFRGDYVLCGDIIIYVQTIDCKNYGDKAVDNLKCTIEKMNRFHNKKKKA